MSKRLLASVVGAVFLLLSIGAFAASASDGVQVAGQSASSNQQAAAASDTKQIEPSNTNIDVRVLSPGDNGSVSQTNSASSDASASNSNAADQSASQDQGSSGGIQTANQWAGNAQAAGSLSSASQYGAKNTNVPVRVLSPGDNGSVTQSNDVSSSASSTNDNTADQDSSQSQAGSGSGIQTSDQSASNEQLAAASSSASQVKPTNTNVSVRVLSPGNDGDVTQSNSVSSTADATNTNSTDQSSNQDPTGSGGSCGCSSDTPGIQVAKQKASNDQTAAALSAASQVGAKNENVPVRVLSPGDNGSVDQSNDVSSKASASNDNTTKQDVDQDQANADGCGCHAGSEGIQVAEQSSWNEQGAAALSFAEQKGAQNENTPVRVKSKGDDGDVSQSNSVDSTASASNSNSTYQDADQKQADGKSTCGCDGLGIQVTGQESASEQGALAASAAIQDFGKSECGCHSGGNSNNPVRVWSPGSDGSVSQTNSADSTATADNSNSTDQDARQYQSGGSGIGIQALGQESTNGQLAIALSGAFQLNPSNNNDPTRVYSPGGGGSVSQSNTASSDATAKNTNDTDQYGSQKQYGSGGCGCSSSLGIQALGQSASNWQKAFALSAAVQLAPHNANGGAAVWSPSKGKGGSTSQQNDADSSANGTNGDGAEQVARQQQG
jgi:epidermal growth factor receptor substrate 15